MTYCIGEFDDINLFQVEVLPNNLPHAEGSNIVCRIRFLHLVMIHVVLGQDLEFLYIMSKSNPKVFLEM